MIQGKKVPSREVIARGAQRLAEMAHESNAGEVHLVLRNDANEPIGLLLYVNTEPEDVQQMLDAIEAVANSWSAE